MAGAMSKEPGTLTGNCHLLAGFIAGQMSRDASYKAIQFDSAQGTLFLESPGGNIFRVEIRQIAGTE